MVWQRPLSDQPPSSFPLCALYFPKRALLLWHCLLSTLWEELVGENQENTNSWEIPALCVISTVCLQLSKHNLSGRLLSTPRLQGNRPLFDL